MDLLILFLEKGSGALLAREWKVGFVQFEMC